ncbi:MAG: aldo/keto reductase [Armatimonadota bacterium]|nr:aldo/keto reductase [Armatimonadota bacterium]MDR7452124.1 aldo/keto reductase [Armatimonadota bacterium]MDR7467848.1 aldo/keto reductase [Armatimonadota bacterium]MDR7494736.1 aldo/keto reductase [Armatimonadota bacterium]MDR7499561.1 aldo/keto reductase [Armatimonadota bacterium]
MDDTTGGRQTITLGPGGPRIAALGVGTWPWGDRVYWGFGKDFTAGDIYEAFEASLRAGLTFFDTAEVYAGGRSERFLGECIRRTQASVVVATKFMPFPYRLTGSSLRQALRRSLTRLGLPAVDLYQMHWPFPPVPVETWMAAMADAYEAGLIRAVGVCNYPVGHLRRAHEALARRGIALASNQVKLSLVDRRPLHNGLRETCRELGVTLIAWGPLAKGALTGKYGPDRPPPGLRGRRYSRQFFLRHAPLLRVLREIALARGKTQAQVALNWCIAKGALPIPGAKTGAQARENAGALGWSLTAEEMALLDGAEADPPG